MLLLTSSAAIVGFFIMYIQVKFMVVFQKTHAHLNITRPCNFCDWLVICFISLKKQLYSNSVNGAADSALHQHNLFCALSRNHRSAGLFSLSCIALLDLVCNLVHSTCQETEEYHVSTLMKQYNLRYDQHRFKEVLLTRYLRNNRKRTGARHLKQRLGFPSKIKSNDTQCGGNVLNP